MIKSKSLRSLIVLLFIATLLFFFNNRHKAFKQFPASSNGTIQNYNIDVGNLIYTKHARCRMKCRKVDESEVKEIIEKGNINLKKSNSSDKPCPTIAYEGFSHDNQHLRIVVADCEPRDKVITVIDLETDFKCDCY